MKEKSSKRISTIKGKCAVMKIFLSFFIIKSNNLKYINPIMIYVLGNSFVICIFVIILNQDKHEHGTYTVDKSFGSECRNN